MDAPLPAEMAARAEEVGVRKAALPGLETFVLAVLAGAFISLGALFMLVVTADGGPPVLGGLAFCLGLILVVVAGAELFTGNNLIVMAWASRRVGTARMLGHWAVVYAGNLAGAVATALLVHVAGAAERVAPRLAALADAKAALPFPRAFALGILCNALVCLAVWLCHSARSTTDRILSILFPITAFVTCGFEHCVANMYLFPQSMLARGEPGLGAFLGNLVPVTLGNVVGGAGMVGLVYWFVYVRRRGE